MIQSIHKGKGFRGVLNYVFGRAKSPELVGGNMGLGYLLTYGEGQGNTAMVFVTIIMLTIIGIFAYGAMLLAERRVLHYLPRAQYRTA